MERKLSSGVAAACLLLAASGPAAGGQIGGADASPRADGAGPTPTGGVGVVAAPRTAVSSPAGPAQAALLPVVLPDLGRAHASVRAQLREAYAAAVTAAGPGRRGEAWGELGRLLVAGEYLDEAESCFRNAHVLAPDDFRWPYYLGHLFRSLRAGWRSRSTSSSSALRLRPDDLAALTWLGQVHIDAGRPEAAEPHLARARALHPGHPGGAVPARPGRCGQARLRRPPWRGLEDALRLEPAATAIRYPLAMAYRGLGDLDTARAYLDGRSGRRAGDGAGVTLPDPLMAEVNAALRSPQVHWDLGLVRRREGRLARGGAAVPGGGPARARTPRRAAESRPWP